MTDFPRTRDYLAHADEARDTVTAELDAADGTMTTLENELHEAVDREATLQAQFDAYRDAHPETGPPPPTTSLQIGASVQRQGAESQVQAYARLEDDMDATLDSVRYYIGTPTLSAFTAAGMAIGGRHAVISCKGAPTDSMLAAIPELPGRKVDLVRWHEPENDGGDHTVAWFQGQLRAHFAQVDRLRAAGRKDLRKALCVMTWLERDNAAGTSSADWFPPAELIDADTVLGLDPYDTNGLKSMQALIMDTLKLWRARGGRRFSIYEWATARRGAAMAAVMQESATYLRAEGAEAFHYFSSNVGSASQGPLDDPAGLKVWGDLARA